MTNGVRPTTHSFCPVIPDYGGLLAELLMDSYRPLCEQSSCWEDLPRSFRQFDAEVFQNSETLGRCVFLTRLDGQFIGFSSFDPRQAPLTAVIGHNCIVPRFQNRGLGKAQVIETLSRLKQLSFRKATVTTSEHPFFLPARRMYLSCGFIEVCRSIAGPDARYRVILLEQEMTAEMGSIYHQTLQRIRLEVRRHFFQFQERDDGFRRAEEIEAYLLRCGFQTPASFHVKGG